MQRSDQNASYKKVCVMSDTPLHLVLFDFDGTLCDSASTIIRLMKQACAQSGLPMPTDNFVRGNIGHGVSHAALLYAEGDAEKAAHLANSYRRIARDEYLGGKPPLDPLFDGAKKVLSDLQTKGYLTGVVTNKSRTGLDSLLGRHGLEELLDVSVSADDCMVKPAPDMAFLAMRKTGVEAANTLLVGDTTIDAGCAANACIGFIGVSWGYHSAERLKQEGALHILTSYDELPDVVDKQFDQ